MDILNKAFLQVCLTVITGLPTAMLFSKKRAQKETFQIIWTRITISLL
jgi:hypothetical protein